MNNWEKLAVQEFADVISGATPDTSIARFWNGTINWITPVDLSKLSTRFIFSSIRKISIDGLSSCATTILPAGSVVMSSRAPIGYFAIGQTEFTTNQGCKSFLFKKKQDSEFHYYSFSFNVEKFKQLGAGSTFAEISKAQIEKIVFDVPPLPEQQKIAKILRTVDGQIEKTEAIIAKYKAIKQGLMQDLFTRGIDVGTGKLRPRYQDAPELYKSSRLGMIPKEWDVVKLGSVTHTFSGGTPTRSISGNYGGSIPWVSSGELNQPYIYKTKESITDFALSTSSARWIKKDTVLIAMYGATAGQVSMVRIPATSNQAVLAVEESQEVRNYWLYFLLGHIKDRIIFYAQGSGQPNLSKAIIDNTDIVLPNNINEQDAVIGKLIQIDSVLRNESIYLDKLSELKNGLMSDLLSGKVRVQVGESAIF